MSDFLTDLCNDFDEVSHRIMNQTSPENREWAKVKVLCQQENYLDFLQQLIKVDKKAIKNALIEFEQDLKFRQAFIPKLKQFETMTEIVHGDIRFHSLTLYVIVRLTRPKRVIETGVASGKSTSMILLALYRNGFGHLYSIDLPNLPGNKLADGSLTHTGDRPTGWLVPDYLQSNWSLSLGNSRELLPSLVKKIPQIDLFLHDSLHTYEHVKFEMDAVRPKLGEGSIILVDNIDMEGGVAFKEFLKKNNLSGYGYRNFGGCITHNLNRS